MLTASTQRTTSVNKTLPKTQPKSYMLLTYISLKAYLLFIIICIMLVWTFWASPCSQCLLFSSLVSSMFSILTLILYSLKVLSAYFSLPWFPLCSQCLLFSSLVSMLTFLLPGLLHVLSALLSPPWSTYVLNAYFSASWSQCLLFSFLVSYIFSVLTFLLPGLLHVLNAYFSPPWPTPCSLCFLLPGLLHVLIAYFSPPWSQCLLFSSLVSSMFSMSSQLMSGLSREGWLLNRFATKARFSLYTPSTTSCRQAIIIFFALG